MLINSNYSTFYPSYQCAAAEKRNGTSNDQRERLLSSSIDSTVRAKLSDGKSVKVCISAEAQELMRPCLQSQGKTACYEQVDSIMKTRALLNVDVLATPSSLQQKNYNDLNVLRKTNEDCKYLKIYLETILKNYQSSTIDQSGLASHEIYDKASKYHKNCQFFESKKMVENKLEAID